MAKLIETMVPDALAAVNEVCENALSSGAHKHGDWRDQGIEGCLDHGLTHFEGVYVVTGENFEPDQGEDHLTNLCCRALMALQLRIEQNRK